MGMLKIWPSPQKQNPLPDWDKNLAQLITSARRPVVHNFMEMRQRGDFSAMGEINAKFYRFYFYFLMLYERTVYTSVLCQRQYWSTNIENSKIIKRRYWPHHIDCRPSSLFRCCDDGDEWLAVHSRTWRARSKGWKTSCARWRLRSTIWRVRTASWSTRATDWRPRTATYSDRSAN